MHSTRKKASKAPPSIVLLGREGGKEDDGCRKSFFTTFGGLKRDLGSGNVVSDQGFSYTLPPSTHKRAR